MTAPPREPTPEMDELEQAAKAVCWFDWSDNDADACKTIERLALALDAVEEWRRVVSRRAAPAPSADPPATDAELHCSCDYPDDRQMKGHAEHCDYARPAPAPSAEPQSPPMPNTGTYFEPPAQAAPDAHRDDTDALVRLLHCASDGYSSVKHDGAAKICHDAAKLIAQQARELADARAERDTLAAIVRAADAMRAPYAHYERGPIADYDAARAKWGKP